MHFLIEMTSTSAIEPTVDTVLKITSRTVTKMGLCVPTAATCVTALGVLATT